MLVYNNFVVLLYNAIYSWSVVITRINVSCYSDIPFFCHKNSSQWEYAT